MSSIGQESARILRAASGDHITVFTEGADGPCVRRIFVRPVPITLGAALRGAVCAGQQFPDELPNELSNRLVGYQVRASLGPLTGLPDLVDAGVSREVPAGVPRLAASYGYAWVTTRWVDGIPLVDARATLSPDARVAILDDLSRLLAELEARGVVHEALAPSAMVASHSRAWLTDLAPLRSGASVSTDHASALRRVAAWLLEDELAQANSLPGVARWRDVLNGRRHGEMPPEGHASSALPDEPLPSPPRKSAGRLDTIFIPDEDPQPSGAATSFVPDDPQPPGSATMFVADDLQPLGGATVFVPDDPPSGAASLGAGRHGASGTRCASGDDMPAAGSTTRGVPLPASRRILPASLVLLFAAVTIVMIVYSC